MKHAFKQVNRSKKVRQLFDPIVQSIPVTKESNIGTTHTRKADFIAFDQISVSPVKGGDLPKEHWQADKVNKDVTLLTVKEQVARIKSK